MEQRFAGRILPLETAELQAWARQGELAGQPIPLLDALLMATAQCHGLTIVTRNVKDFASYSQLFNPWEL